MGVHDGFYGNTPIRRDGAPDTFRVPASMELWFYANDGESLPGNIGNELRADRGETPRVLTTVATGQAVPREIVRGGQRSKDYYLSKYQSNANIESHHFLRYAMHPEYRQTAAELTRAHAAVQGEGFGDHLARPECIETVTPLPPPGRCLH
jgi:hypothetical protein